MSLRKYVMWAKMILIKTTCFDWRPIDPSSLKSSNVKITMLTIFAST